MINSSDNCSVSSISTIRLKTGENEIGVMQLQYYHSQYLQLLLSSKHLATFRQHSIMGTNNDRDLQHKSNLRYFIHGMMSRAFSNPLPWNRLCMNTVAEWTE